MNPNDLIHPTKILSPTSYFIWTTLKRSALNKHLMLRKEKKCKPLRISSGQVAHEVSILLSMSCEYLDNSLTNTVAVLASLCIHRHVIPEMACSVQ